MLLGVKYLRLANAQLDLKKHAEAAQTAAELTTVLPNSSFAAYEASRIVARCAPLAEADPTLVAAKRLTLSQQYAQQAVAVLRQAIRNGYRDLEYVRHDADLDPLRGRPDFQEALLELERNTRP
jgi:hypothetical protein